MGARARGRGVVRRGRGLVCLTATQVQLKLGWVGLLDLAVGDGFEAVRGLVDTRVGLFLKRRINYKVSFHSSLEQSN